MDVFHWYGFFIGIGIWVGSWVAQQTQNRLACFSSRYSHFSIDELLLWLFLPALIGARLYHVIDWWWYYQLQPQEIIAVWHGGLGILGGIGGGIFGVLLLSISKFRHRYQVYLLPIFDVLVFGLPIAQAFGRIGNFINQELFGLPTTLPWGISIDVNHRPPELSTYTHFHPLFAYEALLNLLLATCLWLLLPKKRFPGFFVAVYLIGYGSIRFCLDFLRINPWHSGWLTTAQWFSLVMIGVGGSILVMQQRHNQKRGDTVQRSFTEKGENCNQFNGRKLP